jgi:hypothetical protein
MGEKSGDFVGHYDTRVIAHGKPGAPYSVSNDPSLSYGVSAVVGSYFRNELGWKSDAFYAGPFGGRWPTTEAPRGDWTSVLWDPLHRSESRAPMLVSALHSNPRMRVILASGCFDLATPFATPEYDVSHLELDAATRARVEFKLYKGGHAAYTDAAVRKQFYEDGKALVEDSTAKSGK